MKRHPALVPLSHDHHHTLVRARELRRAAEAPEEERRRVVEAFLGFYAAETLRHFREEEELLFPLLLDHEPDPPPLLARALVEHVRVHALVDTLRAAPDGAAMLELGRLLEEHVRLEERELFELIQELVPEERLAALALSPRDPGPSPVVQLVTGSGRGALWGTATADLNATVLAWPPGEGAAEHVNEHRDVLVVVLRGSAAVEVDGETHRLREAEALVVEKGRRRRIRAGGEGVRYLAVHLRRPGLAVAPAPRT